MHPIAEVLKAYNNTEVDNVQFLARIVPQNSLPESHKFYNAKSQRSMLHYYPNTMAPNMIDCYDFMDKCVIPSNCYHTQPIFGKYLPQNLIDRHSEFAFTREKLPLRPMGRYVIVTYVLKTKFLYRREREYGDEDENPNKRVKK